MTNYVINIDKLIISFNNENLKIIDISDFRIIRNTINKKSKTHKENYKIQYQNKDFGYISHKDNLRPNYSKIHILNKTLYTVNYSKILNDFLITYQIANYKISLLEICLNTNKKLIRNYYNHLSSNKITLKKDYKNYSFLPSENRFTHYIKDDTIYIKKIKKTPIQMRIENKTKEVKQSSNKDYILNYYLINNLDTIKDIYRLEISLNLTEMRNKSRLYKYQNKNIHSDIITPHQYNNLNTSSKLNYNYICLKNDYDIDILNLKNPIYLIKLFNTFSVFNYKKLIKSITDDKIIFENKTNHLSKNIKIEYNDIENPILLDNDFDSLFD